MWSKSLALPLCTGITLLKANCNAFFNGLRQSIGFSLVCLAGVARTTFALIGIIRAAVIFSFLFAGNAYYANRLTLMPTVGLSISKHFKFKVKQIMRKVIVKSNGMSQKLSEVWI